MKNASHAPGEDSAGRTQDTNRDRAAIGEAACPSMLRVQVTVRSDEHPELFAELTKNTAWGFAAKRFKSLATQGLMTAERRSGDVKSEPRFQATSTAVSVTTLKRPSVPVMRAKPMFGDLLARVMKFVRPAMTTVPHSAPHKTISQSAEKGSQ